jgi:hypothetical protein
MWSHPGARRSPVNDGPDARAATILQEFRQRLCEEAEDAADLRIRFGVSGGAPGQRLTRQVRLDARRDYDLQLERGEARSVLTEASDAALHLGQRSRHRLVPDSLVGLVEVESRGRSARFIFAATQEAGALRQRELVSNELDRVVKRLMTLSHQAET